MTFPSLFAEFANPFATALSIFLPLSSKEESERTQKRDNHKNKMLRRGMFMLFIAFILQAIAIFLNVAYK
jgi:hypothetical protein